SVIQQISDGSYGHAHFLGPSDDLFHPLFVLFLGNRLDGNLLVLRRIVRQQRRALQVRQVLLQQTGQFHNLVLLERNRSRDAVVRPPRLHDSLELQLFLNRQIIG